MSGTLPAAAPPSPAVGGVAAVALAAAGQFALALSLFGGWAGVTDANPVVAGRHPLHLVHGTLGADAFRARFETSCYDPRFQAGYPKTPVFDGGSRPAELALTLFPGLPPAAGYKLGLVLLCTLAPAAVAVAAAGAGVPPAGWGVAAALGCAVWWSAPGRALLDAGHADLLGVGLAGLVFVGTLPRYADRAGPGAWVTLTLAGAAGWYCQPVLWVGLFPVGFAFYAAAGPRHGPAWHLGLGTATAAGLGANLWWLADWVRFWWLRHTSVDDLGTVPAWPAVVGVAADYADIPGPGLIGWVVLAAGGVGLVAWWEAGRRTATGVVLTAAGVAVALARLGQVWPAFEPLAAGRAGSFAVACFALPAAHLSVRLVRLTPIPGVVVAGIAAAPLLGAVSAVGTPDPLPTGLTADQLDLAAGLTRLTTPAARTLWEDPADAPPGWNWAALLPGLTGRALLGGLDPDAGVEHSFATFRAGKLNGRPLAEWTAADRAAYVARYNVGWVACRTPAAASWWAADPTARVAGTFRDPTPVTLFALDRKPSFVLRGTATVERMDATKVVLTDVTPDAAGEVALSLHYQPGFRAAPASAAVGPDKDAHDPVPMLKLTLPGPASRVVLVWRKG